MAPCYGTYLSWRLLLVLEVVCPFLHYCLLRCCAYLTWDFHLLIEKSSINKNHTVWLIRWRMLLLCSCS